MSDQDQDLVFYTIGASLWSTPREFIHELAEDTPTFDTKLEAVRAALKRTVKVKSKLRNQGLGTDHFLVKMMSDMLKRLLILKESIMTPEETITEFNNLMTALEGLDDDKDPDA